MPIRNRLSYFAAILGTPPRAVAVVRGSNVYPGIYGEVRFYQTAYGTLVTAEFTGLPSGSSACTNPVFGFHIHSGSRCTGNFADPFADTLTHYNPYNCNHPYHAGDLPPLLSNQGYAWTAFFDRRFTIDDIIGKSVIIHAHGDDFFTQPSGNPGKGIACGDIRRTY